MRTTARALMARTVCVLAAAAATALPTVMPATAAETASATSAVSQVQCRPGLGGAIEDFNTRFLVYYNAEEVDSPGTGSAACFEGTGTFTPDCPRTRWVHASAPVLPATLTYDHDGSEYTARVTSPGTYYFLAAGGVVDGPGLGDQEPALVTLRSFTIG
ncbi:hypothetical protein [Streptomyces sp. NPDC001480]|uniref:hypothetical protein n=1 Tax=Streptomyces sp. NPDC001480 TaxID=3364577 RepID=UPI0036B9A440